MSYKIMAATKWRRILVIIPIIAIKNGESIFLLLCQSSELFMA